MKLIGDEVGEMERYKYLGSMLLELQGRYKNNTGLILSRRSGAKRQVFYVTGDFLLS